MSDDPDQANLDIKTIVAHVRQAALREGEDNGIAKGIAIGEQRGYARAKAEFLKEAGLHFDGAAANPASAPNAETQTKFTKDEAMRLIRAVRLPEKGAALAEIRRAVLQQFGKDIPNSTYQRATDELRKQEILIDMRDMRNWKIVPPPPKEHSNKPVAPNGKAVSATD